MKKTIKDRRKSKRISILETFHVFIVLPSLGSHRLKILDIGHGGILLKIDFSLPNLYRKKKLKEKSKIEAHMYLNSSLRIPLQTIVRRVEESNDLEPELRVALEIDQKKTKGKKVYRSFVDLLEELISFL